MAEDGEPGDATAAADAGGKGRGERTAERAEERRGSVAGGGRVRCCRPARGGGVNRRSGRTGAGTHTPSLSRSSFRTFGKTQARIDNANT